MGKKGVKMSLGAFAGEQFAINALPTESTGAEAPEKGKGKKGDKGKGKGGKGDRDGDDSFDTRGGNRDWRGDNNRDFGERGSKGGGRGGGGGFRDRGSGGGGGGDDGQWRSGDKPTFKPSGRGGRDADNSESGGEDGGFIRGAMFKKDERGSSKNEDSDRDDWRTGRPSATDDTGSTGGRPRLNLKARTKPIPEGGNRDDDSRDEGDFVRGSKFKEGGKADDSPKGREGMFGTARGGGRGRDDDEKSDSGNWRGGGGGGGGGGRDMFGTSRDKPKAGGKYVPPSQRGGGRDRDADGSGSESGFRRGGGGGNDRFEALRRGSGDGPKKGKPGSPGEDKFEEEEVDGFQMINNKKGGQKSKFDAVINEEKTELKSKNKFGGLDSDDEQSSKEDASDSGQAKDSAQGEDDESESGTGSESESGVKRGKVGISEARRKELELNERLEREKEEKKAAIKNKKQAALDKKAREEAEAAEAKRIEEEAAAKAKAIEDEKNAEKNAALAELEAQKAAKDAAALELKVTKKDLEAERKRKAELLKEKKAIQKNKYKAFDADKMAAWEKLVKAQFGPSPDLAKFDVQAVFAGAELAKNLHQALYLVTREILHNAFTAELCTKYVDAYAPVYAKMFAEADVDEEICGKSEVLYGAAKIVANEMRSPATKSLPVYAEDGSVSLSETFFDAAYLARIVDEEHILGWYDDVDDETKGRQDVLIHLTAFIDWLKREDEDEEDEDEDEEEA